MGVFVPLVKGCQVVIRSLMYSKPLSNGLWFTHNSGPATDAQRLALTYGVTDWWHDNILIWLSSSLVTDQISVIDWTAAGIPAQINPFPPGAGGQAYPALAANVAAVIGFLCAVPLGGFRGRHYLAGLSRPFVAGNTIDPFWRAGVEEGYSALPDIATSYGFTWVCVSQYLDNAPRSTGLPARVDFARFRLPWTGQRRKRLSNAVYS